MHFILHSAFIILPLLPLPALAAPGDPALAPDSPEAADTVPERSEKLQRMVELTRRSAALIKQKKWDQVEAVLEEALTIVPDDPISLYNLACAKSRLGKLDTAMDCLERAAAAGINNFDHVARDPDLDPLHDLPRFKKILAERDRWQRKAAERVVKVLRDRFGPGYLYEIDEPHKLIFATNVSPEKLQELKQQLEAQARGQYRDLFSHKPDAFVSVVVPSADDYRQIMRLRNVGGVYFNASKTLVAQRIGEVMRHEFTHALHAADRAPLGQDHAPWVAEGLGVLYETARAEKTEAGGVIVPRDDNDRLPAARGAARRKSLIPLERLLKMDETEFLSRPNITYAQSGSVMLFLREKGRLRTFYDAYKDTFDADPTGKAALEKASGMSLADFENGWSAWLREGPVQPFTGGPAMFLGARVAPTKQGLEVVSLAANGPAASAGLRPRDVITAVNGKPVKDYASIRPALGAYTPNEKVTLRVVRDGQEWDADVTLSPMTGRAVPVAPGNGAR